MKRLFYIILIMSLLVNTCACAEGTTVGIESLMVSDSVPEVYEITHPCDALFSDVHDEVCKIKINKVTYGCEFEITEIGDKVDDWIEYRTWLAGIVKDCAKAAGNGPEALAKAIDEAITRAKSEGGSGLWTNENIVVTCIRVSTPFYQQLSNGDSGDAVLALQNRLIVLGFTKYPADGSFGAKTENAVIMLQNYVRELEQEKISESVPEASAEQETVETDADTSSPSLIPAESLAADSGNGVQPATEANGIADGKLLAYLYSQDFPVAGEQAETGSTGSIVERIQNRLCYLGYSSYKPDGEFGSATATAIATFQSNNGLESTGVADETTQLLLFSENAQASKYAMMSAGSSGSNVKEFQTALVVGGFAVLTVDGNYGEDTKEAVKNLRSYMTSKGIGPEDIANGSAAADPVLLEAFYADDFPAVPEEMSMGDSDADVMRLQMRLKGLKFYSGQISGNYDQDTYDAVYAFQKRHSLTRTGNADSTTLELMFSAEALEALNPYEVRVSIDDQRVYVYGLDDNNEYTDLVRTMVCSTGMSGNDTPKGTYQSTTGPRDRWHYFTEFNCWAQYAYTIEGGVLFHSVIYKTKGGSPTSSSVSALGSKASHGCVRLSVEDAKWIYENCPRHTKVVVY